MEIINIKSSQTPILELEWSDKSKNELNVKDFLAGIIKDPKSEYWRIIEQGLFEKVSIYNGGLNWPSVLEVMYCGGDTTKSDVKFSAREIEMHLSKTKA